MQASATGLRQPSRAPSTGHRGALVAGVVVLVLFASVVFPLAVVLLGVLVVALVALDAGIPGLVPGLRALFRVPVAPAFKRRIRLLLAAGVGVMLATCGTTGAKLGGQLRTEWKLRQSQRMAAEEQATEHLERAQKHLAASELELAELTLMDARRISALDPERQREIDQLLDRLRRSGDSQAILDLLLRLPAVEFESFARGDSLPKALEFPERALTYRAVGLARAQVDEARAARARQGSGLPLGSVASP